MLHLWGIASLQVGARQEHPSLWRGGEGMPRVRESSGPRVAPGVTLQGGGGRTAGCDTGRLGQVHHGHSGH